MRRLSDANTETTMSPADVPAAKRRKRPDENKFHIGNGEDGKHYWLTPPKLMAELSEKYGPFDFDPRPYPKPENFDGLTCEWGRNSYVNPPFGSIMHQGKKKGPTAWARKAIEESSKGKRVTLVYPIDKWVLMLLAAGAEVTNLGDVRWLATEDGSEGKGTGRHIACFSLGLERDDAVAALIEREAALIAQNEELERLCDATYVAQGADAYQHACETMEAWQRLRAEAGKDAGCEGSLCDGLSWLQSRVDSLEAQAPSALREKLRSCEDALNAAEKREAALIAERDALAERVKALEGVLRIVGSMSPARVAAMTSNDVEALIARAEARNV